MIKDRKGRFTGNDLWSDEWGWALFDANDRTCVRERALP